MEINIAQKFGTINSGVYDLGLNVDWKNPNKYVEKFKDGFDYKVYKKVIKDTDIISLSFKEYLEELSVSEFKNKMKVGEKGLPLPLFMSLFELDALDLFYFEGYELNPLREVSRKELTYFMVKLSKEFSKKFISNGDNTY